MKIEDVNQRCTMSYLMGHIDSMENMLTYILQLHDQILNTKNHFEKQLKYQKSTLSKVDLHEFCNMTGENMAANIANKFKQ